MIQKENNQITNNGFTLLELLVVLVIISIMSALVGPRFANTLTNINVKTVSKKIAASLRYARSRAVSEKRVYISIFDFDKKSFTIGIRNDEIADKSYRDDLNDDKADLINAKVYKLPEGIIFEKAESTQGEETDSGLFQILFYPVGNSSGGKIILADEREKRYQINVDFITGTVQIK